MEALTLGDYTARPAKDARDLAQVMDLRQAAFARDRADEYDDRAGHMLVTAGGRAVASFRWLDLPDGPRGGYCARWYDLDSLQGWGSMVEVGRFCIAAGRMDPNAVRIAWAAIGAHIFRHNINMVIGCSSFRGADPARHRAALAVLAARHLGPSGMRPGRKAAQIYPFAQYLRGGADLRAGLAQMPPLLRAYLAMGGWVGDHAVIDRQLDTLHVFTAIEAAKIPPQQTDRLRRLTGYPTAPDERSG